MLAEEKVQRDDGHIFPGHIACDAASNAEIVISLKVNGTVVGMLDIDSVEYNRFDSDNESGLVPLTDGLCEVLANRELEKYLKLTRS